MGSQLSKVIRRVLLVAAVAAGGITAVVCTVTPVYPQTAAQLSARACSDGVRGVSPSPAPAASSGGGPGSPGQRDSQALRRDGANSLGTGAASRVVSIHDPTGDALDGFFQALTDVERGGTGAPLARIAFFGDSHTASDQMTGHLRRLLQKRFGDGGHGFVAAGRPWPSYRHYDVEGGESGRWDAHRVRHPRGRGPEGEDGRLGLAGLAVESEHWDSEVWIKTSSDGPVGHGASRFELFYLSQPRGGRLKVSLDGTALALLSSRAPAESPSFYSFRAADGPHEVRVKVVGRGLVRLFGFVLERNGPGVVLDSLGVNGARVMTPLAVSREILTEHLARRSPDLVVMWYGTNEVGDEWYSLEQYEQWVIDVLTVLRRAAPGASCLFVGPPDMGRASYAVRMEEMETPAQLYPIMAAQKDAAELVGCAHWSLFEAMGGRDSMARWADVEPPLAGSDGVHYTRPGYEAIAELLYAAIMDGYEQFADRGPNEP